MYICICMYIYIYVVFILITYRGSAAHDKFHFIGPALTVMCHSIKEKVLPLSKYNSMKVKTIKRGQFVNV